MHPSPYSANHTVPLLLHHCPYFFLRGNFHFYIAPPCLFPFPFLCPPCGGLPAPPSILRHIYHNTTGILISSYPGNIRDNIITRRIAAVFIWGTFFFYS